MRDAKWYTTFALGALVGGIVMAIVLPNAAHANADTDNRSMRALESIASTLKTKCK